MPTGSAYPAGLDRSAEDGPTPVIGWAKPWLLTRVVLNVGVAGERVDVALRSLETGPDRAVPGRGVNVSSAVQDDDQALLARVRLRDGAAFRLLVVRHLPMLLAIARRMLRDDAEAEDVAQEALIKLWQGGANLELGTGGAKPWLRRVVSNLCIDKLRAGRRIDVTDEVPEQEIEADQLAVLEEGETAARVDVALKTLPERQRLALTLFHYEGLSQVEVGEILGVSDEAVESLLSRARRSLRTLLKDDWRSLLPETAR